MKNQRSEHEISIEDDLSSPRAKSWWDKTHVLSNRDLIITLITVEVIFQLIRAIF